jgi:hypothetical protein
VSIARALSLTLALGAAFALANGAHAQPPHPDPNQPPDTWFAGPDSTLYPVVPGSGGQRYVDVASWLSLPPFPGSLLSCDSLAVRPAQRPRRKTFFEFYGNHVFVRSENDTVNRNSWLVFHNGGSDTDSPYSIRVGPGVPALLDTVTCAGAGTPLVVRPDGVNGSPVGFRIQFGMKLDPGNAFLSAAASGLYPLFDPGDVFYAPQISGYLSIFSSGKAYVFARAEDGNGRVDPTIQGLAGAIGVADSVDLGLDTSPSSLARREKVFTFFVNRNPFLDYGDPAFVPKPPEYNGGQVAMFPGSRILHLNILSSDPDPFTPGAPPGGPTSAVPLPFSVTVSGLGVGGQDTSFTTPVAHDPSVVIDLNAVAPWLVGDELTIHVRICDCESCDLGRGRCVTYSIPARIAGPVPALASLVSAEATSSRARLRWAISGTAALARLERRTTEAAWQRIDERMTDAGGGVSFEDASVTAGTRYVYRLSLLRGSSWTAADEVSLEVPHGLELALEGVRPNPGSGPLSLGFSLPDDRPASIEVFDASGRRVWSRNLSGAGRRVIGLGEPLAPALYVARLTHGGAVLTSKFSVVR